ncbi:Uncharacterised protein [BD1-7 clade bacterium]|uniref:PepSY domain-containing protein n=1 Tax=BD1-7 clade bacterium TaxID=2029982 RepID=A0A5S9N8A9_9GAMM|nr:Uncharacterised protein [BD1-7 clade bacterium]
MSTAIDKSDRTRTHRIMLALHGWSALVLGLLLYAVIVTGAVAVFEHEIGRWSNPLPKANVSIMAPGLDDAIRQMGDTIDPAYMDEIALFPGPSDRLRAYFHYHGEDTVRGVLAEFDPSTWTLLNQREGTQDELFAVDQTGALARFLVDLHVRLYLPSPWGLFLTGVLGLAMLLAAITGLVIHRKLIKELFLLRISTKNPLLSQRDRHALAGTWNLVFAFLLAFTGSFFSFAGSFGIPLMAMIAAGGDEEKLAETVIAMPQAYDSTPTPSASLDDLLADIQGRYPDAGQPLSMSIERWGRADGIALIEMAAEDGQFGERSYLYSLADGQFMREKPQIGVQPSFGSGLLDVLGPLHFGNFAGFTSKALWFCLGIASAWVVYTGMMLWFRRREGEWKKTELATVWICLGLPLGLAATPAAYFLASHIGLLPATAIKMVFVVVSTLALASLLLVGEQSFRRFVGWALALCFFAAPLTRMLSGGIAWSPAFATGYADIVVIDGLLLSAALFITWRQIQGLKQPQEEIAYDR